MNLTRLLDFVKQSAKSKTVWLAAIGSVHWLLTQDHVGAQEIARAVELTGLAAAVKDATVTAGKKT